MNERFIVICPECGEEHLTTDGMLCITLARLPINLQKVWCIKND